MPIPLGVDRKLAHQSAAALKEASGNSGPLMQFLATQVKNPTISITGEVVTPTTGAVSVTVVYSTSVA